MVGFTGNDAISVLVCNVVGAEKEIYYHTNLNLAGLCCFSMHSFHFCTYITCRAFDAINLRHFFLDILSFA